MEKTILSGRINGELTPPSSKSYAQRAIAAALLAKGESKLSKMELCSDTQASMSVARALGATITPTAELEYTINGGISPHDAVINIGESGLATRLFTPIAALWNSLVTVTGAGSIMSRPMTMMIEPLKNLGVDVKSKNGYLPLTVCGPMKGGETAVDGRVSSQFVTGLLMSLPLATNDTVLRVDKLNSIPYINMTLDLVARFGVRIEHNDFKEFFIEGNQSYTPRHYSIEGDWSGASCMLVAGAVAGKIRLHNLNPLSLQADVAIIDALAKAGAEIISTNDSITVSQRELHGFEFDATHCPDLFPALVALASHCGGESIIVGTERLQHKESDRAVTLRDEFGKLGIEIDIETPNVMKVIGGTIHGAKVDSHNDHRIAMATAVAGLCGEGAVEIRNAEAVNKSYPKFWDDLCSIRG